MDVKELAKDEPTARKKMRMLMARWGRVADMCEDKIHDVQRFGRLIDDIDGMLCKSDVRVSGGAIPDPTASAAENLISLKGNYQRVIEDRTQECKNETAFMHSINEVVDELKPEQQRILCLHYKDRKQWNAIARKMSISESHARLIEREALDELTKRITVKTRT